MRARDAKACLPLLSRREGRQGLALFCACLFAAKSCDKSALHFWASLCESLAEPPSFVGINSAARPGAQIIK